MEKSRNLRDKAWYRTLKVLYILANILGIGVVILLAYAIAYTNPFPFLLWGILIVLIFFRLVRSIFLYIYDATPFWSGLLPKAWLVTLGVILVISILSTIGGLYSHPDTSTVVNDQSNSIDFQPITTQNPNPATLAVTILETDDGMNGLGTYADQYPTTVTLSNIGNFSHQLAAYGASYKVWIAPAGWTGQGGEGVDGNVGVNLYPVGGSTDSGPNITYTEVPACLECMLGGAAPYFPDAMKQYNATYNQNGETPITISQGIEMTVLSPTLIRYSLPDMNGLSTQGVVYYNPDDQAHAPYAEAKIVLPENESVLSNFLIQTFINREGLK